MIKERLQQRAGKVRVLLDGKLHTDTLIDACCGTGGFLIDALADMWRKVDRRGELSSTDQSELKDEIANTHIVGIDVANAPKLARIARLNMYLHGDGGTRIFHLSALDKGLKIYPTDNPDIQREKNEFQKIIENSDGFDVALTNPPFAKAVDRSTDDEKRILDGYDIGRENGVPRPTIRSCLLFAERYRDLLRPGGRLVTIIDDGILSGDDHRWFRDKLREWFLIRAVISLPGDAFQRSNARVKTSFLIAEKRDVNRVQAQPPVFMYPCQYVGIDDQKRQRAQAGDSDARDLAEQEINMVLYEYQRFVNGESQQYRVAPERVMDRLDVKNCLMVAGRSVNAWRDTCGPRKLDRTFYYRRQVRTELEHDGNTFRISKYLTQIMIWLIGFALWPLSDDAKRRAFTAQETARNEIESNLLLRSEMASTFRHSNPQNKN